LPGDIVSAPLFNRVSSLSRTLTLTHITLITFTLIFVIYALSPQGSPAFSTLPRAGEVVRVGLSVAHTGAFANPFYPLPTGPTAHNAPGYVLLFALVAKVFGEGLAGAIAIWSLNVGFLALQLALLPLLSERLGLGVMPGLLAAAFGAIFQPYRVLPEWESLLTGALIVALAVLTVAHFQAARNWKRSGLLGFLWGIALLTNPQCVWLLLAWPVVALWKMPSVQRVRASRALAAVAVGAALVCLPWFIRNYEQFHAVFFVRDNLGLELYTSNNSCATATMLENYLSRCHFKTHPNVNLAVATEVLEKGEIRFNQERMHQAFAWISENPRAFASLTVRRFRRFWFPYLTGYRYAVPSGLLTLLSFFGLGAMFRKQPRAAWVIASVLVLYPLINYVVQFEARYRYPIYWATLLPAAYAVLEIPRLFRKAPAGRSRVVEEENELVPILNRGAGAEGGS
jgi:hypothetical protein